MKKTITERFWEKVEKNTSTGCWEWQASLSKAGYGQISCDHTIKYAHRLSAEWAGMNIDNKVVCHICDNPKCVNPEHFFIGLRSDNSKDMKDKGRHIKGREVSAKKCMKPIMTPYGKFGSLKEAKENLKLNPRSLREKLIDPESGYYYLEKI
jgi:hypothetical protein